MQFVLGVINLKVSYYCGMNIGNPFYTEEGLDFKECCSDGVVDLTEDEQLDFNDRCLSMTCPSCGCLLTQDMDHFETA